MKCCCCENEVQGVDRMYSNHCKKCCDKVTKLSEDQDAIKKANNHECRAGKTCKDGVVSEADQKKMMEDHVL